ncbi:DMT family transporter [Pseudogemmobacter bohemicus]|uniref:DMT family transporter n=1 Tax=Pseudogemmobacter bohemicus TaxID=2250708 RepID=UPI000DD3386C|nr:DMT family transporter [Pseudogemmobacter bohemicus]
MQSPDARNRLALPGLLLGGVLIGCSPIWVRLSEVGSVSTAFWRLALALIPLLLLAGRERAGGATRPKGLADIITISLPGVILGAELVAWHISLNLTSVANSTLLVNMAPVFVALFAWIALRKPPGALFALALAVTIFGVVVLKGGPTALGEGDLRGDAVAIFAAMLYAAYILMLGRARQRFATGTIMLWSTVAAALAVFPFALITEPMLIPLSLAGWAVLLGLSWISQAGGQSLIAWALAFLPATFSSLTLLLQPVIAALLAWVVLDEALTLSQALGGVIVLCGIWIARAAQMRQL